MSQLENIGQDFFLEKNSSVHVDFIQLKHDIISSMSIDDLISIRIQ